MNERTRLKRAVLRDRRRGYDSDDSGPALFGPMTGFDLYLTKIYTQLATVAQLHHMLTHPEETRAVMSEAKAMFTEAIEHARANATEAGA